jgi:hypothetical protein
MSEQPFFGRGSGYVIAAICLVLVLAMLLGGHGFHGFIMTITGSE